MKSQKKLETIIDLVFISVILAIGVNLISNKAGETLEQLAKKWFPNSPNAFIVIVVSVTLLMISTYVIIKIRISKTHVESNDYSLTDRLLLLDNLNRRYKERKLKKMDDDDKLNMQLELKYTKEGTDEEYVKEEFLKYYDEKNAGDFENLFNEYENKIIRLLIIGEPGSGKTTLLLRFALKLILKAKEDPLYPIPIILNLSSWRNEYENFKNWLEENLVYSGGQFGTSKENAKRLAQSNNIILLLDGLDEIPEMHRVSCLKKLHEYLKYLNKRETSSPELILCCRKEEYLSINANAPVQAAVRIEPLNAESIERELANLMELNKVENNVVQKLKNAIEKNQTLGSLLTTAFYFHIALSLVDDAYDCSKLRKQHHLVTAYMERETFRIKGYYPKSKVYGTLGLLATMMNKNRKGISFELTDMQPNWLKMPWLYRIILGACYSLLYSMFIPLIFMFLHLESMSIYYFVALGFAQALIYSVLYKGNIEPSEIRQINIKRITRKWTTDILKLIPKDVLILILFIKVLSIMFRITYNFEFLLLVYLFNYTSVILFSEEKRYPIITNPYQRLLSPLLFDIVQFMVVSLLSFSILYFTHKTGFNLHQIIISSFQLGILVGLTKNPIFRYFALQLALVIEKSSPFFLVRFLNIVSKNTGLMEREGGQWRFRHKLIEDEFYLVEYRKDMKYSAVFQA